MKVAIVGASGSGKTTLAKAVAAKTHWHRVEIDELYHQPNWEPQEPDVFRAELRAALDREHWVCDGNYNALTADIVRAQATTIVVFDLPRWQVLRQVTKRTIKRSLTREVLWNGNREPLGNFTRWDPEHNVIRWSWVTHRKTGDDAYQRMARGEWDHAEVIVLRSHADGNRWLATLG